MIGCAWLVVFWLLKLEIIMVGLSQFISRLVKRMGGWKIHGEDKIYCLLAVGGWMMDCQVLPICSRVGIEDHPVRFVDYINIPR